jgi:hypothetical protein
MRRTERPKTEYPDVQVIKQQMTRTVPAYQVQSCCQEGFGSHASPAALDSCVQPDDRIPETCSILGPEADAGRGGTDPPDPKPTYLPPWFGAKPSGLLALASICSLQIDESSLNKTSCIYTSSSNC